MHPLMIKILTVLFRCYDSYSKLHWYGWMDDLRFYVLFNSVSVISGRWADDNERLCAMEPVYGWEDLASSEDQTRDR